MLERSWRAVPGPLSISPEDIHEVAPQLLATGTGALAWHCIQSLDPPSTGPFLDLRNAYRQHAAESAVHQINTSDIFTRVRAAGIEPVLFKGWGLARLYPDAGLRPYGDIDLWVEDLQELSAALPSGDERVYCVDPHVSFYPQYERSFDDVMRNSHLVNLDDVRVRVPADEDQLRFICLHFLFHGAWRPLWLCDIALMVELTDSKFDWDRCLGGKRKHADWIACAIGLAHQLLGADVSGTPVEKRAQTLPRWLTTAVLKQWEKGNGMSLAESLSFSLPRRLLNPRTLVSAISEHWRNPIQASVEVNAWFNESPRLFFQFVSAFPRIPEFIKYFGTEIRRA
ncbi:MAG TPA: nucleotidyltransferase family protein [Pyrinomonadaceae bacterium]|nr:nucleotidyltransferase family protein [Pyrinomonadaceae bacterium]